MASCSNFLKSRKRKRLKVEHQDKLVKNSNMKMVGKSIEM